jgi:DnaJ-class molecular chaperone
LTDPKKKQLYDSGQIEYDGDQGGMGGMNIDPNEVFNLFFGGGGGGFSKFGGFPSSKGNVFTFQY